MVDAKAFSGDFKLNPFSFNHYGNNFMNVSTDTAMNYTALKPNYSANLFMASCNSLFVGGGIAYKDISNDISLDEYKSGYNISIFDLTADLSSNENYWSPLHSGSLRLELNFEKPLAQPVTCLIFAEYENLIEIDSFRQVSCDYAT